MMPFLVAVSLVETSVTVMELTLKVLNETLKVCTPASATVKV